MKLIHLTDTHLVKPGLTLYGLDPEERLRQAVASINALHADADLVVITGDLAHWGEATAYAALAECLDQLRPPCVQILGNHDDRQAYHLAFAQGMRDADGFVQGVRETSAGRLLFLDTNQPGTHMGWYCEQRLAWLAERLAESKGTPVFIFMHHPPFDVGLPSMDRISLQQKAAFAETVLPYRSDIRHLFYGHVHRPISGSWLGIPFSTLRATSHQVWLDFNAGTDIPGSHEPPAYAVVLISAESVVVHTHDFLDASRKFSLGEQSEADVARALEMTV
jgi:3',5'-cyclic AMP phosphodiesterase CpdA